MEKPLRRQGRSGSTSHSFSCRSHSSSRRSRPPWAGTSARVTS